MQGSGNNIESDVGFRQYPPQRACQQHGLLHRHQIIIGAMLYQIGR